MQQLLGAMRGNQDAMDGFVSVQANTLPAPEFFEPANIARIMAAGRSGELTARGRWHPRRARRSGSGPDASVGHTPATPLLLGLEGEVLRAALALYRPRSALSSEGDVFRPRRARFYSSRTLVYPLIFTG